MKDVRPRIKLPVTSIKLILINRYSVHGFDFCLWKAVGVSSSYFCPSLNGFRVKCAE